jgi:hypothetical protein
MLKGNHILLIISLSMIGVFSLILLVDFAVNELRCRFDKMRAKSRERKHALVSSQPSQAVAVSQADGPGAAAQSSRHSRRQLERESEILV